MVVRTQVIPSTNLSCAHLYLLPCVGGQAQLGGEEPRLIAHMATQIQQIVRVNAGPLWL